MMDLGKKTLNSATANLSNRTRPAHSMSPTVHTLAGPWKLPASPCLPQQMSDPFAHDPEQQHAHPGIQRNSPILGG